MARIRKRVVRTFRRVAGQSSALERKFRGARDRATFSTSGTIKSTTSMAIRGDSGRLGIYGFGGCDVWAIAESGQFLSQRTTATVGAYARGLAEFTRSDLILQAFEGVNMDDVAEVSLRLNLDPLNFESVLFEPTFMLPGSERLGPFSKDVVELTSSSELVRTLNRHREL